MSSWKKLDALSPDVGESLGGLAGVLTESITLRIDSHGIFLFAPIKPVLDGQVDATLTVEDESDGPDRAALLVFPNDESVSAAVLCELLNGLPDLPLPDSSSLWLCKRADASALVVLEIRFAEGYTRRFQLDRIGPMRRAPSPVPEKRREGPGNLERRSDWFQGDTPR